MASNKTMVEISKTTLARVKAIKKVSGISIGKLADRGLDFFCSAVKKGEVVVQNGEIVPAQEAAR